MNTNSAFGMNYAGMSPQFQQGLEMSYGTQSMPLTIDTGFSQQSGSSLNTPLSASSALRRRQNYNITDSGPTFGTTKQLSHVFTADRQKTVQYTIHAKMDKGFFMCDGDWTCYRRNYFQASGAFSCFTANTMPTPVDPNFEINPAETDCYVERDGELLKVVNYRIGITSRVAAGDKIIDLVQHTSKRDKGPQHRPEARSVKAGGNVFQAQYHQILATTQFVSALSNQTVVTFERLQFKSATANNGKRRAAQQYYVIVMELFADCESMRAGVYETIKIATCASSPLVVRGRSPGHYENGKPTAYGQNSAVSPYMTPNMGHMHGSSPMSNATASMYTPPVNYMSTPASETLFSPVVANADHKNVEPVSWENHLTVPQLKQPMHEQPEQQPIEQTGEVGAPMDNGLPTDDGSLFSSTASFPQFDDQSHASELYGSSSLLSLASENSLLESTFGEIEHNLVPGETHQW